MTKDEIVNKLVVLAINGIAAGTYRDTDLAKKFCALPLKELADFWPVLTSPTKLMILDAHAEEFMSWIKSNG